MKKGMKLLFAFELLEKIFWKSLCCTHSNNFKDFTKIPKSSYTSLWPSLRFFSQGFVWALYYECLHNLFILLNKPLDACERIVRGMPKQPNIRSNEQRAYYNRLDDYVNVPRLETFTSSEDYDSTLFHELVHSTGHKERLNRRELLESRSLRSDDYAVEELTAEIGASYLESYAGIPAEHLEDNASYIQCWLERLRNDRKFIIYASAQAQRAADYILNIKDDGKELGYVEGTHKDDSFFDNKRLEELATTRQKKSAGKGLSIIYNF